MEWIGQHIWDHISRFRSKVFVESGDLEISKVTGQPVLELSAWSATATAAHAGLLKFQKAGTAAVDTFTAGDHTTSGEILGRIEAYGVDDADGSTLSSYIEFANDAVSDADSSPGKIVFATSDADDAGTPTVRLTIDDDGKATFVGAVSVGGRFTFDSVEMTAVQTSAETFNDDDVSIMTSAAILNKIESVVTAEDLDVETDDGNIDVDLNSEALAIVGGEGIDTSGSSTTVTIRGEVATASNKGVVELATTGEATTGTDTDRAVTPAGLKAYADRPSAQLQYTYHNFTDDIDTTKIYLSLADADTEGTTTTAIKLPFTAPLAGKLMRIFLRANQNLSGKTLTWRLETQGSSVAFGTGPSVVGTQSGAGCNTTGMTTYDFTSSLDSGDNIIDAGDVVYLSIQSNAATSNTKFYVTCLWEWDVSSIG